ncbi:hypothetical protein C8N28_1813 [Albibacterium bauzanense]|uniref:Attachment p12 family protein n=1 Tax=Albibacterium bauzanense TaxID=653929 RepID=A0A4R1M0R9_9SPHI|nr:hypothetical protein C8N28_1813 [Albibacterium bauzanense]
MDVQLILVFVLFGIALLYLGRTVYLNVKPKKGGACKTCSACSDIAEPLKKKADITS